MDIILSSFINTLFGYDIYLFIYFHIMLQNSNSQLHCSIKITNRKTMDNSLASVHRSSPHALPTLYEIYVNVIYYKQ
jgi:hypothetical protein